MLLKLLIYESLCNKKKQAPHKPIKKKRSVPTECRSFEERAFLPLIFLFLKGRRRFDEEEEKSRRRKMREKFVFLVFQFSLDSSAAKRPFAAAPAVVVVVAAVTAVAVVVVVVAWKKLSLKNKLYYGKQINTNTYHSTFYNERDDVIFEFVNKRDVFVLCEHFKYVLRKNVLLNSLTNCSRLCLKSILYLYC